MLNQAALLFIHLLFMWKASADVVPTVHRNVTVSRGEPVTLNCSINMTNITQISWRKDTLIFVYLASDKLKLSNLTSDRLQIDIDSSSLSTLKLLAAQPDDAGRYICQVIARAGVRRTEWSLHVSEEAPDVAPVGSLLYLLTGVPVLLLCVMALTVCCCR
ncbi:unnamed protein product [Tetraodon nigroviridis]|nr:unnamed protein product [Tetraodon nigroviridis]